MEYKNLVLNANDPSAYVELMYDEPKAFDAKGRYAKPGDKSYKFTVRMLAPFSGAKGALAQGDEAGFWVDNERHVQRLMAFRRGDRLKLTKFKNPDMNYTEFSVEAVGPDGTVAPSLSGNAASTYSEAKSLDPNDALGLVPHDPAPNTAPVVAGRPDAAPVFKPRMTMEDALVEAVTAVHEATKRVADTIGTDEAGSFYELMSDGEVIQKLAVTIFMRG